MDERNFYDRRSKTYVTRIKLPILTEKKYGVPFTNPNFERLAKSCLG